MLEVAAGYTGLAGMAATAVPTLHLAQSIISQICLVNLNLCQQGFRQAFQAMNAAEAAQDQRLINWSVTQTTVERHHQQVEQHCKAGEQQQVVTEARDHDPFRLASAGIKPESAQPVKPFHRCSAISVTRQMCYSSVTASRPTQSLSGRAAI
ncbi:hypothetical protein SOX05_06130 [Pseudomonas putida]|nr:hypothetical protein [Pseudomonas putida]MDY4318850.1 hypothetical protein [Pseudomonas putida]MDY4352235.1 hypothetical protein [Pseudomonas putida]